MSVEWFRVHIGLRRHPKYLLLRAKVGAGAMEYLHGLWSWAAQARRDGVLRAQEEAEIAADWSGPKGELHAFLVSTGFLDADGVTLHDWPHHNGDAIASMIRSRQITAERVRRHRENTTATPTATATATATATGNAAGNALRNALPNENETTLVQGKERSGTNGRYQAAWSEYRNFCAGCDGYATFERWMGILSETGIDTEKAMAWFRENKGRHVHEAKDALMAPVQRPPRPGSEAADRVRIKAMLEGKG